MYQLPTLTKAAAAQLVPCDTCRIGCECDGAVGTLACDHFACLGRGHDNHTDCPGAAYERYRSQVLRDDRAQEQIRLARLLGGGAMQRVIDSILVNHGLVATGDAA